MTKRIIKIDEYHVYEKGREYEILVFPFIKHMWAYDNSAEWGYVRIDGTAKAHYLMCYALDILARNKNKIIYFPCKQEGIGGIYHKNWSLVMCRPELQLRRSLWFKIKKNLDKKHLTGRFKYTFDPDRSIGYFRDIIPKKFKTEDDWVIHGEKRISHYKKKYDHHVEEVIGDTAFLVLTKEECFQRHFDTLIALRDNPNPYGIGWDGLEYAGIGYILGNKYLANLYKEKRKDEEYRRQQELEFEEKELELRKNK